jgi:hypothetical protein
VPAYEAAQDVGLPGRPDERGAVGKGPPDGMQARLDLAHRDREIGPAHQEVVDLAVDPVDFPTEPGQLVVQIVHGGLDRSVEMAGQ